MNFPAASKRAEQILLENIMTKFSVVDDLESTNLYDPQKLNEPDQSLLPCIYPKWVTNWSEVYHLYKLRARQIN